MFGIDDILIGSLLGGGLSALTGKDPIKGAALGGLGGAVAPGLLGGGSPATGQGIKAATGQGTGLFAQGAGEGLKQGAQMGMQAPAGALTQAPQTWLLSSMSSTIKDVKPLMDAAGTGLQVAQATQQPRQQIMPSPMATPMPNNNLGQIVAGMQQDQAQRMQQEAQLRAARRGMWG
jgi:hypothetical protein